MEKTKFKTNVFRYIYNNFHSKMTEIIEMKELVKLMIEKKHWLMKSIYYEQNFKVKLNFEDQKDKIEKHIDNKFAEIKSEL